MRNKENEKLEQIVGDYKYGFVTETQSYFDTGRGLNEDVVRSISKMKNEPEWMLEYRLKAYHKFMEKRWPTFGPDVKFLNFDDYIYYIKSSKKTKFDVIFLKNLDF